MIFEKSPAPGSVGGAAQRSGGCVGGYIGGKRVYQK